MKRGVVSESFSTKLKSWDRISSLLCVKHFMLLLLLSEQCLDLSWDSRLFMIGTFPASSPHLWPLLPSASLRLGCEISWVLRALHALPCLQGFARADSVWNSLLLFLLVILLACLGLDPVSPAWEPFANLLLISAAPSCHSWALSTASPPRSQSTLYLEEQVTPPEENHPPS